MENVMEDDLLMAEEKRVMVRIDDEESTVVEAIIAGIVDNYTLLRLRGGGLKRAWFFRDRENDKWDQFDARYHPGDYRDKYGDLPRPLPIMEEPEKANAYQYAKRIHDMYIGNMPHRRIRYKRQALKAAAKVSAGAALGGYIRKRYKTWKHDKSFPDQETPKNENDGVLWLEDESPPGSPGGDYEPAFKKYDQPSSAPGEWEPPNSNGNGGDDDDFNYNNMKLRKATNVLDKTFSMQRMHTSVLQYHMSAVKWCKALEGSHYHCTVEGQGPALYTTYDYAVGDSTNGRNMLWNCPKDPDSDFGADGTVFAGVGWNSICYVFAADWPWKMMNHDVQTRRAYTQSQVLEWKYNENAVTNDQNVPLKVEDFILVKDWKYIKIYGVDYIFDMTNYDQRPYCVEIVLFRFKADPDAMDYEQQVDAMYSKQKNGFPEYINYANIKWSEQDVKVISRKRIYLQGSTDLTVPNGDTWSLAPKKNTKRLKFRVKRQYVLKRPILTNNLNIDEDVFFEDFYEPHRGIYCRVQAWPASIMFMQTLNTTTGVGYKTFAKYEEDCVPTAAQNPAADTFTPGVDVRIMKKAYYKFDMPRIKTLSTT